MKYTVDITIDLPRSKVIELFDNPDNMHKWQPDLVSFEPMSGAPGQPGAKSKLQYKMGKREIEMIETVTKNELPSEMSGTYETKGVFNNISNRFEEINEKQTRWVSENEFQFSGFMKLMGIFMKGAFPKQTLKFMNQFKAFAEGQAN
ncbi:Polyketide cyclase / dehydrase and lipid transport [Reichenbachiella faecimaris]|uniref:Polyketide cyclase / dehydrase and lipid transport n=1 Tax=Reichenbachiella faecimaris TaxID=692418 RepID=A0A1W2GN45_REIFA|nr:SRPBCC family protein [Reichenbachiella faecimaris]SMD37862.1 Polyketide cyclase / dehydrase and lipid transport [Reichenbachiella faecimaris]